MRAKFAKIGLLFLVVALLLISILVVSAHESRTVGDYNIVFGWRVEPAFAGQVNGPSIRVTLAEHEEEAEHDAEATEMAEMEAEATEEADHAEGEEGEDHHAEETVPVLGLEETLQVEISFGPATRVLTLRAVHGDPGHYTADIIPTMPGDYSFRIFGTIDGVEIDEVFDSADGQFSSIQPIEDIQFP